jgi:hypothetical protein
MKSSYLFVRFSVAQNDTKKNLLRFGEAKQTTIIPIVIDIPVNKENAKTTLIAGYVFEMLSLSSMVIVFECNGVRNELEVLIECVLDFISISIEIHLLSIF